MKLHQLTRRGFQKNSSVIREPIADIPWKKPHFVIDNRNSRPATFASEGTMPRKPKGVDFLNQLDTQMHGDTVQLSDKTLEKMFKIKVDDPTDLEYLNKKTALVAGGRTPSEIEALIGRQRQISKHVNIAAQGLAVTDKIELLERVLNLVIIVMQT